MIKLLGNLVLLGLLYGAMYVETEAARGLENHRILAQRIGLAGIVSIGAGVLIITGGIDLSIGAVVAFLKIWSPPGQTTPVSNGERINRLSFRDSFTA